MSVEVRHNGERWDVDIATSSASTPASLLEALQTRVAALSNIAPSFQKLLYKGKNLAKHPEPLLRCLDQQKALRVMLVGSSAEAVEASRAAATAAAAAVASRRGVRFEVVEAAAADASGTLFNALEPLPGFADGAIASAYLARLARDRGVKVVMERHGWRVGVLFELFPKGNVGLSPSCLMGINVNKGQRIGLRLRTDDLAGWRPYASVRKVLFHELTHMEHSEHGIPFNEYMAALLREADANDWTVSVGHRLDGGAVPKVRHGSESTRRRAVVMSDTGQVYTGGHGVAGGGGAASGGAGSTRGSRRAALARAAEARLATSAAAAAAAADKVVVAVAAAELVPAAAVAVAEAGAAAAGGGEAAAGEEAAAAGDADDVPATGDAYDPPPPPPPLQPEPVAAAAAAAAADPTAPSPSPSEEQLQMRAALSQLEGHVRTAGGGDAAIHAAATRALQTALTIVENALLKPTEKKFERVRLANRAFHARLGRYVGAAELLRSCGFKRGSDADELVLRRDQALLWLAREEVRGALARWGTAVVPVK